MAADPLRSEVVKLVERPADERDHVVANVHSWSEASQVVLADVADALRRLEERGGDDRHLARFRWSLFKALRELHAREESAQAPVASSG